ncbi:thiol-disulfide oxidoreductase DCC family protein [Pedobacter nutrimenti]|uniref:thiol-disulfide oxidoreductase DCC family protein n=1 Tax=Pedobacter nutrimenti TaxID=1241337 RepID=UPI0029319641|nr:DCC1-like thiol-disulfide oxidoreductase family protein [Pedobacter nutrimenti]
MERAIIFFDGVCNLCNASVQFVIKRDVKDHFRFSALQNEYAKAHLKEFEISSLNSSTILLLENGKLYTRSTAALRIARQLSGLWPLCYGLIVIPAFIRDVVYKTISKYRYKIWGRSETCMIPSPELKAKFL